MDGMGDESQAEQRGGGGGGRLLQLLHCQEARAAHVMGG